MSSTLDPLQAPEGADGWIRNAGRRIRHSTCTPKQIPPFCFLAPGRSVEASVALAIDALGTTRPVDIVLLLWTLRATSNR